MPLFLSLSLSLFLFLKCWNPNRRSLSLITLFHWFIEDSFDIVLFEDKHGVEYNECVKHTKRGIFA